MRKGKMVKGKQTTIRMHRKETNNDLLTEAYNRSGRIRLNVMLRIKHWETGNYSGWNGSAIMIDAPTPAKANEFYAELRKSVVEAVKRIGCELPGAILVEG